MPSPLELENGRLPGSMQTRSASGNDGVSAACAPDIAALAATTNAARTPARNTEEVKQDIARSSIEKNSAQQRGPARRTTPQPRGRTARPGQRAPSRRPRHSIASALARVIAPSERPFRYAYR